MQRASATFSPAARQLAPAYVHVYRCTYVYVYSASGFLPVYLSREAAAAVAASMCIVRDARIMLLRVYRARGERKM